MRFVCTYVTDNKMHLLYLIFRVPVEGSCDRSLQLLRRNYPMRSKPLFKHRFDGVDRKDGFVSDLAGTVTTVDKESSGDVYNDFPVDVICTGNGIDSDTGDAVEWYRAIIGGDMVFVYSDRRDGSTEPEDISEKQNRKNENGNYRKAPDRHGVFFQKSMCSICNDRRHYKRDDHDSQN